MSTTVPPPNAAPPATQERNEIKVVSHSNLFYWWPVWAVGFLMAILTAIDNSRMVTVPPGTKAYKEVTADGEKHEGLVLPKGKHVQRVNPKDLESSTKDPWVHMSSSKNYGVIFCVTLLICIVITNVPLRGMWSLVAIIFIIMLSLIFALFDLWERIFFYLDLLDVRINMGGYLLISGSLFILWLVVLLVFDQQIYIVFTPGQFKVRTEIGGGEKVYDVVGMKLERQRSDLFRHMILGLGSGDLIVKTAGASSEHFDLPNVLFISKKVQHDRGHAPEAEGRRLQLSGSEAIGESGPAAVERNSFRSSSGRNGMNSVLPHRAETPGAGTACARPLMLDRGGDPAVMSSLNG